jgi:hypothetical protein
MRPGVIDVHEDTRMSLRLVATGRPLLITTIVGFTFAIVLVAMPAGATSATVGNDISYPQCGMRLPSSHAFGVVGVNGGRAFTKNPCLVQQLAWAKRGYTSYGPAFYANTGNPGPAKTSLWPYGQTWPRVCRASNPNSSSCAYDYGWNAAKHAFRTAVRAIQKLDDVSRQNAVWRAGAVRWWLDVETMNSWQALDDGDGPTAQSKLNDTSALRGAVDALHDSGAWRVGIYSTSFQWKQITGGRAYTKWYFASNPVWLAGYDNAQDALNGCSDASFTGAPVLMTQYLRKGFDVDVRCQ